MAALSVHDKSVKDKTFVVFLPIIKRESCDDRNFVKKAVNWALRQIGKRSFMLNAAAIKVAEEILKKDSRSAKWIARDALRELQNIKTQEIIKKKEHNKTKKVTD
jgi:3-methyladenine DNA glycosylase AlkD